MYHVYDETVFRICTYELISGLHVVNIFRSVKNLCTICQNSCSKYQTGCVVKVFENGLWRSSVATYFWRFCLTRLLKDILVIIFWITILTLSPPLKSRKYYYITFYCRYYLPWLMILLTYGRNILGPWNH